MLGFRPDRSPGSSITPRIDLALPHPASLQGPAQAGMLGNTGRTAAGPARPSMLHHCPTTAPAMLLPIHALTCSEMARPGPALQAWMQVRCCVSLWVPADSWYRPSMIRAFINDLRAPSPGPGQDQAPGTRVLILGLAEVLTNSSRAKLRDFVTIQQPNYNYYPGQAPGVRAGAPGLLRRLHTDDSQYGGFATEQVGHPGQAGHGTITGMPRGSPAGAPASGRMHRPWPSNCSGAQALLTI